MDATRSKILVVEERFPKDEELSLEDDNVVQFPYGYVWMYNGPEVTEQTPCLFIDQEYPMFLTATGLIDPVTLNGEPAGRGRHTLTVPWRIRYVIRIHERMYETFVIKS